MNGATGILVMGGGLAGLSASYHARVPSLAVEKSPHPGGTARSYQVGKFTFDYTGHLLHLHHPYTKGLVRRLLKGNIMECRRDTWIHSHGRLTRYPYQGNLFGLPEGVAADGIAGLWRNADRPPRSEASGNFAVWSEDTFGPGIARHFLMPYNRKLWRVDPSEMTPAWCGGFVPKPSLPDVMTGALIDHAKAYGYNARFLYPRTGGIQALPEALAASLKPGTLLLNHPVASVRWKERVAVLASGKTIAYQRAVSTLPLPELMKRLDPFPKELAGPLKALRWTSVLCVNLGVGRPNVSRASWIYFPEPSYVFYRVGFPMNFTPHVAPKGHSSMYVEVSYRPGKAPEQQKIVSRVRKDLEKAGILRPSDRFSAVSVLPIPYAYVVYDRAWGPARSALLSWLKDRAGIWSIGRYGGWKYSFMEEAILDGRAAVREIEGSLAAHALR